MIWINDTTRTFNLVLDLPWFNEPKLVLTNEDTRLLIPKFKPFYSEEQFNKSKYSDKLTKDEYELAKTALIEANEWKQFTF